jgi:hypothetical protein
MAATQQMPMYCRKESRLAAWQATSLHRRKASWVAPPNTKLLRNHSTLNCQRQSSSSTNRRGMNPAEHVETSELSRIELVTYLSRGLDLHVCGLPQSSATFFYLYARPTR